MGALLSVVVPIYNVGAYLAECLDSLVGQTWPDLEVVLVDDGSTDDSAAIAARYTEADLRFRLVRQPNRGLGAARNAGIAAATGDYLGFVDSDDVLPPYALEVLVGALEQTGSDFATGNVALLTSRGLRPSPLHRGTHRRTRLGISLRDQRNLVYDRLACNKVFRRSFFDRHRLRFPEGVRYEDIPLTIPAYALATSVDVLDLPVYYWRQREAGELSISQRQTEPANLRDRVRAVDSAARSLAAIDERLRDWYDETVLQSDLRMFLDLLPSVDEDYRRQFLELTGNYLTRVEPKVIDRLPPRLRVAWHLVSQGALPELLTLLTACPHGSTPTVVRRDRRYYHDLPLLDAGRPDLPRRLFQAPTGIRTEVHEIWWSGDLLHVRGTAYDMVRGAARPWQSIRLLYLRGRSGAGTSMLPLPVRAQRTAQLPDSVPYGWAGFSVRIDPRRLRAGQDWPAGEWSFQLAVFGTGRLQRRALGIGDRRPPTLPGRWVNDEVRVAPFIRNNMLWLSVRRPPAWVTGTRVERGDLLIEGAAGSRPAGARLVLSRTAGLAGCSYPVESDGSRWVARVPLAELTANAALAERQVLVGETGAGWRAGLLLPGGEVEELPVRAGFTGLRQTGDGAELVVRPADDDVLWIRVLPAGPVVTGANLADGILELAGDLPADVPVGSLRIVLRQPETGVAGQLPPDDIELSAEVAGRRWRVWIPLVGPGSPGDGVWLPLYRWPAGAAPADLPFDVTARRMLPRDVDLPGRRLELVPEQDRESLRFGPPVGSRRPPRPEPSAATGG